MATSYELEQQLQKAKEEERIASLKKELEQNLPYKGKCYATHLLGRGWHKNVTCNLRRVADVTLNSAGTEVIFHLENINFRKTAEGEIAFQSHHHTQGSMRHSWESFRHEITEEQFLTAKEQTQASLEIIGNVLRAGLKEPSDYIDGFQQTEDRCQEEILKACKVQLIALPLTTNRECCGSIAEMLGWHHHPFIYCGKYLVNSQVSKEMVEYIIKDITKGMHSWGGSIYTRDAPRVKALQEFVNNTKWLP